MSAPSRARLACACPRKSPPAGQCRPVRAGGSHISRALRRSTPPRRCSEALPASTWRVAVWRQGSDGEPLGKQVAAERVHRATGITLHSTGHSRVTTGPEGWLIGERPLPGERGEAKWYFTTLPADTSWERLIALAHQRWVVEQFYEDAKGECGLDDYQGRRWNGLHRHVALSMLAYSFLVHNRLSPAAVGGWFFPSRGRSSP
jgi:SRSO17 transposase